MLRRSGVMLLRRCAVLCVLVGLAIGVSGCGTLAELQSAVFPKRLLDADRMFADGQDAAAIAAIDGEIAARPSAPVLYRQAAEVCGRRKKWHLAAKYAERGVVATTGASDLEHARLYATAGIAYISMGQYDKAVAAQKLALRLHPDEPTVLNNLGYAYAEMPDGAKYLAEAQSLTERAVLLAREARVGDETIGVFLDSLGWVEVKRGKISKAIVTLTQALELAPNEAAIYYHLARALLAAERQAEAITVLSRGARVDRGYAHISELLVDLLARKRPALSPQDEPSDDL